MSVRYSQCGIAKGKKCMEKRSRKGEMMGSVWLLMLVFVAHTALVLTLFFLAYDYFGYIILASLVLQQLLTALVFNISGGRLHPVLYGLLAILGGFFIVIARYFFTNERSGLAFKSIFVRCVFIAQILVMLTLFDIWIINRPGYVIFSFIASALVSVYILLTKRGGEERAISIFLTFLLFGFGYLVFLLSGIMPYFSAFRRRYNRQEGLEGRCENGFSSLNLHSYGCEEIKYFKSGEELFESLLLSIESAKKSIYLEFFIYDEGQLFSSILSVLEKKARQGLDVRIIYDDVGTSHSAKGNFKELKGAGVKSVAYNPVCPLFNTFLQYRDHRKNAVIDGEVAYLGGVNVSDEYVNKAQLFGTWKDAGACVRGSAAAVFENEYLRQWYAISGEKTKMPVIKEHKESKEAIPFFDGMEKKKKICKSVYIKCIESAKRELTIMTPYFVVDGETLRAIKNRAKAGVKVNLIVPGVADKPYVDLITRQNSESLMKYGVKVYRAAGTFTHAKVILSEELACVATANFDYQSFTKSSECGIISYDGELMCQIRQDTCQVLEKSREVTEEMRLTHKPLLFMGACLNRLISTLM